MTDYYSVGTGYWDDSAIWSATSGGAGGAGVPTGAYDVAHIEDSFEVTVRDTVTASCFNIVLDDASVVLEAGCTLKMGNWTTNGGIRMGNYAGSLLSEGTAAAPCLLTTNDAVPTYNWALCMLARGVSPDDRVVDLRHCIFQNFSPMIGNFSWIAASDHSLRFNRNYESAISAQITKVTPLTRKPIIKEYACEGRTGGRVFKRGSNAGTVQVSGYTYWSTFDHLRLEEIAEQDGSMCFISDIVQMVGCRIEDLRFSPKEGSLVLPFSMTLVEDQ